MPSGLGLFDWIAVVLLVLVASGTALAAAVMLSRRFAVQELVALQSQLRLLELRLAKLEREQTDSRSPPPVAMPREKAPSLPERASRSAPEAQPFKIERSMETLTQDAAAALASLDAFKRFAKAEGGSGFTIAPGAQDFQPVSGNDPVSASDVWAVPFEGGRLYFPGWNLRRSQSALLADSGRMARDRLGWLFDIEAGEQLAAFKPAFQRPGQDLERGLLTLPF